jgi:hypothetical protein
LLLAGCGWLTGAALLVVLVTAALFSGAPSGISQRWPGTPWAGFTLPLAAALFVWVAGVVTGKLLTLSPAALTGVIGAVKDGVATVEGFATL